jgi:hypothetical protein
LANTINSSVAIVLRFTFLSDMALFNATILLNLLLLVGLTFWVVARLLSRRSRRRPSPTVGPNDQDSGEGESLDLSEIYSNVADSK